MKKIRAREEYCLGCRLCEINCMVKHSRSKKIIKAFKEERGQMAHGIHVEEKGRTYFALQCRHCREAPCIEACIAGAMTRDPETGAVVCAPAWRSGCSKFVMRGWTSRTWRCCTVRTGIPWNCRWN